MDVRLLVVPDCPNETPSANLIRHALAELGLITTPVVTVVVPSQEQAEELGFLGSRRSRSTAWTRSVSQDKHGVGVPRLPD